MTPPMPPERLRTPALRDSIIDEGRRRGASVEEVRAALEAAGFRPKPMARDTGDAVAGRAGEGAGSRQGLTAPQMLRLAGQGVGFGFGDEAEAAVRGVLGQDRDSALAAIRGDIAAARATSPVAAAGIEIAGSLVPLAVPGVGATLAGGRGIATAGRAGRVARTTAAGAAAGGLYGAGAADDGDRLAGALRGSAVGGALGLAAPILGAGVQAAGRAVAPVATRALDAAAGLPLVGEGAENLAASLRANRAARLAGRVDRQMAEALVRDQPAVAAARSRRALRDPNDPDAMLLDMGGPSVRRLARAAAGAPESRAEAIIGEALNSRIAGQVDEIPALAAEALGVPRGGLLSTADAIAAEQAATAGPLYRAAYDAPQMFNPALPGVLESPSGQQALRAAERLAADRGESLLLRPTTMGGREVVMPDVRTVDYLKRGYDDLIGGALARQEKALASGQQAQRRELLAATDAVVPEFAEARAAAADGFQQAEALQAGAAWRSQSAEEIARTLAELTPGQQAYYRQGVVESLAADLAPRAGGGEVPRSVASRVLDPATRQKLSAVFGSEQAADDFLAQVRPMQTDAETRNAVLAGSRTTPMAADMAATFGEAPNLGGLRNATGVGLLLEQGQRLGDRMFRARTAEQADELARVLTLTGDDLRAYLADPQARLDAAIRRIAAARAAAGSRVATTAGQQAQ